MVSYLAYIDRSVVPGWLTRERTYRTLGGGNRYANYCAFVERENDERTNEFYGGDCLTSIFGDQEFRKDIHDTRAKGHKGSPIRPFPSSPRRNIVPSKWTE